MDEPSVMATENALMAAALTPGTTVIRNAASEPHVQDLARMLNKMGARDRGHRLQRHERPRHGRAGRLRAHGLARPHRDRLVHGAGGRHRRRAADQGLRARGPADDPPRLRAARAAHRAATATTCVVPGGQKLVVARDAGDYQSKVEDGPWPAFPADLTCIARGAGHPVRGLGPDLREDVREPPVLRGQADLDGRRDHDLRPAPGDRHRPAPAARRSGSPRPTSAPAWRC